MLVTNVKYWDLCKYNHYTIIIRISVPGAYLIEELGTKMAQMMIFGDFENTGNFFFFSALYCILGITNKFSGNLGDLPWK